MSIDETNKLRAKLGLKPLNVGSGAAAAKPDDGNAGEEDTKEGTAIPGSEVRHLPAKNLLEKTHMEKMREKLQQRRQKRLVEANLLKVKTLGESDSDEVRSNLFFDPSLIRNLNGLFTYHFFITQTQLTRYRILVDLKVFQIKLKLT